MARALVLLAVLAACQRDRAPVDATAALAAKLAADAPPGVSIRIEHRGKVILDRGYGFADLEHRVPATPDTVFAIGSISKQFGAAAILQLVEAGKLTLDDPLAKFLPAFPRAERITIRNLLQHTSGIVDFEYEGTWPESMGLERTIDEVIATFADLPPKFEPGQRWGYSTSNYVLLGKVIEQLSGMSLPDYMTANVFARAGLAQTRFCDSYELIPHRARGYQRRGGAWKPARWSHLTQFGIGGGICSTPRDMLRWQRALESGAVVSAASYQQMATPGQLADGSPFHYGLGLSMLRLAGHDRVMHSGGVSGFTAMLAHYVKDDLRIAVVANGHTNIDHHLVRHLLNLPDAKPVPIDAAQLARYAVAFEEPGFGKIAFAVKDGRLVLTGSNDLPFVHLGEGVFETPDHFARVRFEITNGVVTRVILGFADAIVYADLRPPPATPAPETPAP